MTVKYPWKEECKKKWIAPENLEKKISELRSQNKKIVTLNGSFDLMHAGHLHIIYEAKKQGDILIVALNTDSSIKKYKSEDRPFITLQYRLELMSALSFVDYVTWFEETDPRPILSKIKPDVHVNGAEYGDNCIEAEVVKANGGTLHLVERIDSLSTTSLIQKIVNVCASSGSLTA